MSMIGNQSSEIRYRFRIATVSFVHIHDVFKSSRHYVTTLILSKKGEARRVPNPEGRDEACDQPTAPSCKAFSRILASLLS